MSSKSVKSAFHHTLTAGMAVGATMAAAGLLASPAAAMGPLTVNPVSATAGTSPAFTLNWLRTSSVGRRITVALTGFGTSAASDCGSLGITVSVDGGANIVTGCSYASGVFTLTTSTPAGVGPSLTFPESIIIAPSSGTASFTVSESTPERGVPVNVEILPASDTSSPVEGLASQVPPDWMRQYQRTSQEEQCLPQWNPSYAMWANAGAGGWVCVQTDHWDTTLGRWTLL